MHSWAYLELINGIQTGKGSSRQQIGGPSLAGACRLLQIRLRVSFRVVGVDNHSNPAIRLAVMTGPSAADAPVDIEEMDNREEVSEGTGNLEEDTEQTDSREVDMEVIGHQEVDMEVTGNPEVDMEAIDSRGVGSEIAESQVDSDAVAAISRRTRISSRLCINTSSFFLYHHRAL